MQIYIIVNSQFGMCVCPLDSQRKYGYRRECKELIYRPSFIMENFSLLLFDFFVSLILFWHSFFFLIILSSQNLYYNFRYRLLEYTFIWILFFKLFLNFERNEFSYRWNNLVTECHFVDNTHSKCMISVMINSNEVTWTAPIHRFIDSNEANFEFSFFNF